MKIKWLASAILAAGLTAPAFAGVGVYVGVAPPPLRYEVPPPMPGPGYVWTAGYWNWAGGRYVWAPGVWRRPPYAGAYASLVGWNQGVLSEAAGTVDYFIVHDYFTPYNDNTSAANILSTATTVPTAAMTYLQQQMAAYGVPQKPIALTEWNIQAVDSRQDVSYIAGMHAVKALGSIIKNHFGEASRWDLANGWNNGDDMGMFNNSAGGAEPGAAAWNPRPAFYYQYFFQHMIGDHLVSASSSNSAAVEAYGSSWSSGEAGVILVNKGSGSRVAQINFKNFAAADKYYYYTLNGGTDNAPYSHKVYVNDVGPSGDSGGPASFKTIAASSAPISGGIVVNLPAYGAVFLVAEKK